MVGKLMMKIPEASDKFIISFTEQEVLSLIEILNRAYQIKNPPLMYYRTVLELEKKIRKAFERQIDSTYKAYIEGKTIDKME